MSGYTRSVAKKTVGGFTLVELLIGLLIFSIIVSAAPPAFQNMMDRHSADIASHAMRQMLMRTRMLALERQHSLTLCPLSGGTCSSDWSNPLTIFYDENQNAQHEDQEPIIRVLQDHTQRGFWQKTRAEQNYIRFNEQGHAFSSASTLVYCPDSANQDYAKQIVISFQGRIRSGRYLNSRGTPYSHLKKFTCE